MRYDRQILMPEIGIEGQKKLERAVVTVIGCGGLGSPVLTYLAQAGAGTIRLVDGDTVSDTNLNRQFLYREEDIGKKKADLAAEKLRRMNRGIRVEAFACALTGENAGQILKGSDVVVDCVDSLAVRCIVGRYCLAEDIFLVEGAVQGFYGYVMDISRETACLECLGYHLGKSPIPVPALGAAAGVIGCLQAVEAVKKILGRKELLLGTMLQYDGLNGEFDKIEVEKDPECRAHLSCLEE